MKRQSGSTLFELVTVMAVAAVFASVAVPSAAHVGSAVSGAEGARRLALVLRSAQAEAQSRSSSVRVEVDGGGDYVVTAGQERLMSGEPRGACRQHLPRRSRRVQQPRMGRLARLVESARRALQRARARRRLAR